MAIQRQCARRGSVSVRAIALSAGLVAFGSLSAGAVARGGGVQPLAALAPVTVTFTWTGVNLQQWTVPFGVTTLQIDVSGAQGGGPVLGGLGGRATGTVAV